MTGSIMRGKSFHSFHIVASALLWFSFLFGNRESSAEPAEYSLVLLRPETPDSYTYTVPNPAATDSDGLIAVPLERPPTEPGAQPKAQPAPSAAYSSRIEYAVGEKDRETAHVLFGNEQTGVLEDGTVVRDGSEQELTWQLGDSEASHALQSWIGRGLKSVEDSAEVESDEKQEGQSRVLFDEDPIMSFWASRNRKRRAEEGGATGGGILPSGLQGAMEESAVVVGTFQAMIMPGSTATGLGQQISGFMSNFPGGR